MTPKQTVTCRVIVDGKETKRYTEQRCVYTDKNGNAFVYSMNRKFMLYDGMYDLVWTSVKPSNIFKKIEKAHGR